jgi:hypothetical protein
VRIRPRRAMLCLMANLIAFVVFAPVCVGIAWGTFLGAKLIAVFIVDSSFDQTAMAFLASIATTGLAIAVISTPDA